MRPGLRPVIAALAGMVFLLLPTVALGTATGPPSDAQQPDVPAPGTPVQYGSLVGVVTEADGTPVPGVTVQLEGPLPSDRVRRTVADEDAEFTFQRLPPGTYRLTVELPGLRAPGDVEVTVEAGRRVETRAELGLFAYEVSVSVLAERRLQPEILRREATSGATIIPDRALTGLPLPAEQALEALPVLPGVVRGPQGLISIGGTLPEDSVYLFNGLDFMDPFSGQYRLALPLESVDDIELHTGVYPASQGQMLGGLVDVSTRAGDDDWRFEVGSLIPRPRFRDGTIQGIKRASPRFRLAGPIVPGRLWISQSAEYRFDRDRVRDIPGDPAVEETEVSGWETLTQLDWLAGDRHRFRVTAFGFPQMDAWVGLSGLRPPEATLDVERDAEAALFRHQVRLDPSSFLETSVQYNRLGLSSTPQGRDPYRLTPDGYFGNHFRREDRQTNHFQVHTEYTRALGAGEPRHLVQVGAELHNLSLDASYDDGPIEILDSTGKMLRRIDFLPVPRLEGHKREWAFFVQDRWRPGPRFWLDAGLRLSGDDGTGDIRLAPRLGAALDVVGDRRTLVKASVGLLYRRVFLGELLWNRLPVRVETRLEDGRRALAMLPPHRSDELRAPRSRLATLEVTHQFAPWLTARARVTAREINGRPIVRRVEPVPVPLAPDEDPLAAATSLLQRGGPGLGALELASVGEESYREWELTANVRLGDRTQLFLTCVHAKAEGDLNDFSIVAGELPDPIIRPNRRAPLPFDTRVRVVLWGTIDLPWDLELGPVLEYHHGFPYSVLAEDQSYAGPPNSERFPDFFSASVALTKGFRLFGKSMRGGLQVRNLTSAFNPRDVVVNRASADFRELRNSEPLRLRVRVEATF